MWNPFRSKEPRQLLAADAMGDPRMAQLILLNRMIGDGLQNTLAGIGTARDKRSYSEYAPVTPMSRMQLDNMWASNWLSKRIVSVPVEDALAEWFSIQWDSKATKDTDRRKENTDRQQSVYEWEKRFDIRNVVQEAAEWGRLYGGALIVIGIKGEKDLSKPLNIQAIRKGGLSYLHVIDRWRVGATDLMDLPEDLESPNFGRPRFYQIGSNAIGGQGLIHWSRAIPFHGERLPWFPWLANGMWHHSTLQHVLDDVKDYGNVMALLATMFFEANVDILAIDELARQLAEPNGEAKVRARFEMAATVKSANRMLVIDAKDRLERKTNSFSGLAEVVRMFMSNVSGAANTPISRLFGEQAAGLGSEGKGDQKNYTKRLRSDQVIRYTRPLEYLYEIAAMDMLGEVPPGWNLTFNPLEQETALEKSTRQLNNANRDKTYVDGGMIPEVVITKQLKEDDVYSMLEDADVEDVRATAEEADPLESAKLLALTGNIPGKPGALPAAPGKKPAAPGVAPLPTKPEPGEGGSEGESGKLGV